ncbi:MAG: PH domain-containing protein [Planctomycetota bacterium]|jgi:membrane protein YdbS with pleckstrin-like domain
MSEVARRIYRGLWAILVRWFKVPERPPEPPVVAPGEAHDSFRPAPEFLRYLKAWFWVLLVLIDGCLVALYLVAATALALADLVWVALLLLLALVVLPDVAAYVALHLRYDTTWYVMTDRSLRIRRGIWILHETTITFENVQNLKVLQGPVQRLFGISSLIVETAGAGGDPEHGKGLSLIANRGVIEGITDPRRLRDRIMVKMQASKSAGLGDEEEAAFGWTEEHVAVLKEIREALR